MPKIESETLDTFLRPPSLPMKETESREASLWGEVFQLAIDYASGEIEEPKDKLEEIEQKLGGGVHDIEDIKALMRIAKRAKGDRNKKSQI